jgi:hypothetical protein
MSCKHSIPILFIHQMSSISTPFIVCVVDDHPRNRALVLLYLSVHVPLAQHIHRNIIISDKKWGIFGCFCNPNPRTAVFIAITNGIILFYIKVPLKNLPALKFWLPQLLCAS